MTDTSADQTAQQIAAQGREALLARLRPAFERAAAAHADILQIPPERLEAMIQDAADRADGLQWRRALAGVAVDQLGIDLGEALRHPAVARAQELLGVPAYEDAFPAGNATAPQSGFAAPSRPAAQPEVAVQEPELPELPEPSSVPEPSAGPTQSASQTTLSEYLASTQEEPEEPEKEEEPTPPTLAPGADEHPAASVTSPAPRPYWEVEEEPAAAAPHSDPETEPKPKPKPKPEPEPELAPAPRPAFLEPEPEEAAGETWEPTPAEPEYGEPAEPATAVHGLGMPSASAAGDPSVVHLPAVHLGGIANLAPGESGLELRFADPGLDIAREDDAVLGRIAWEEIRDVEVAAPGRLRRRRKDPEAKLVIRTDRGDASFRIPGADEDELRMQLAPALTRIGPHS